MQFSKQRQQMIYPGLSSDPLLALSIKEPPRDMFFSFLVLILLNQATPKISHELSFS